MGLHSTSFCFGSRVAPPPFLMTAIAVTNVRASGFSCPPPLTSFARFTCVKAKAAKDAGVVISYDPNLRLPLWPSTDAAREGILSIWEIADIIKISEEEVSFLTQGEDPYDDNVVRKLYHPNLKLLLVTEGPDGCRYYTKEFSGRVEGVKVDAVDTTGAGDAFVAGVLSQLALDLSLLQKEDKLRDALKFANACGALTVTERGAIPALPTREAVLNAILKSVA